MENLTLRYDSSYDEYDECLEHHGIKGMRWGIRRFQNKDGSLTSAGEKRYDTDKDSGKGKSENDKAKTDAAKFEAEKKAAISNADVKWAYENRNKLTTSELTDVNTRANISRQLANAIPPPKVSFGKRIAGSLWNGLKTGVTSAASSAGHTVGKALTSVLLLPVTAPIKGFEYGVKSVMKKRQKKAEEKAAIRKGELAGLTEASRRLTTQDYVENVVYDKYLKKRLEKDYLKNKEYKEIKDVKKLAYETALKTPRLNEPTKEKYHRKLEDIQTEKNIKTLGDLTEKIIYGVVNDEKLKKKVMGDVGSSSSTSAGRRAASRIDWMDDWDW